MEDLKYKENVAHGTSLFPMRCYEFEGRHGQCMVNLHWHDEMEWIYVTRGTLKIQLKDAIIEADVGDVVCVGSQVIHQITSVGDTHYYALVFSFDYLSFQNYDAVQGEFISPIVRQEAIIDSTMVKDNEPENKVRKQIERILNIYIQRQEMWELSIKVALYEIVLELYQGGKVVRHRQVFVDEKSEVIKQIIIYIKMNAHKKLYIEEIANHVHLNPQYVCRLFKLMSGKTLVEYMNEYRIEQACHLLHTTTSSVMDIAFQVGFENVSYFIHKFKKHKQATPQQYRAQRVLHKHFNKESLYGILD